MTLASLWFILGLLLMLAELVIPGFVILFFGVGAWVAAAVAQFTDASIVVQGYVFAIASVLSLVIGRRFFRTTFYGKQRGPLEDADEDGILGAVVVVTEAIEPPLPGKVALHGSDWTAIADKPFPKGATVTVCARNNITLTVR